MLIGSVGNYLIGTGRAKLLIAKLKRRNKRHKHRLASAWTVSFFRRLTEISHKEAA